MAQKLNIFSGRQFLDSSGDPYVGAKLFVYTAGSSTKATITKDSAGTSNHANPIILNARGEPADGAGAAQAIWQTEGSSLKLVLAPAGDTDPPTSAISSWDNLAGVNDTTLSVDQWVSGDTPTYVNATSFTIPNDQTSDYHVGRRIKTTNTGGTIYSTIITSAYTSLTTITVINDSGTLDSGLSAVSYGLISAENSSISVEAVVPVLGANIASAAALTYPAYGTYSDVTGTTTITSFLTSGTVGTVVKRHFDGVLTLTHHATNLILPNGANIVTFAGFEAEFVEYASGQWRMLSSNPAIGSTLQIQTTQSGVIGTGTTVMPFDDSAPQNTEGDEYLTVAITPKTSSSTLIIEGVVNCASSVGGQLSAALFQDSTAGSLRASSAVYQHANQMTQISVRYTMTSGTVSATTFKIRVGNSAAGTTTFNGVSAGRIFAGLSGSYLTVREIL